MAFAEVGSGTQRATAHTSVTVSSLNCAFPGSVVAGNLLIVAGAITHSGSASVSSVTDSVGTTYTVFQSAVDAIRTFIAFGLAAGSGANTVTVNAAASGTFISYSIDEFSGANATPFDDDASPTTGTSTAPLSATAISTVANDLLIASLYKAGTTTITPGAGFTQIGEEEDDSTFIAHGAEFKIVGASGNYTANWTLGASVAWITLAIVFKPAVGAAFIAQQGKQANQAVKRSSFY